MVYHSKKDWWLMALVWFGVLLPSLIGIYLLIVENGSGNAGWTMLFTSVFIAGVVLALTYPLLRNQRSEFDRTLRCVGEKRNTSLVDRGSAPDDRPAECSGVVARSSPNRLPQKWGQRLRADLTGR